MSDLGPDARDLIAQARTERLGPSAHDRARLREKLTPLWEADAVAVRAPRRLGLGSKLGSAAIIAVLGLWSWLYTRPEPSQVTATAAQPAAANVPVQPSAAVGPVPCPCPCPAETTTALGSARCDAERVRASGASEPCGCANTVPSGTPSRGAPPCDAKSMRAAGASNTAAAGTPSHGTPPCQADVPAAAASECVSGGPFPCAEAGLMPRSAAACKSGAGCVQRAAASAAGKSPPLNAARDGQRKSRRDELGALAKPVATPPLMAASSDASVNVRASADADERATAALPPLPAADGHAASRARQPLAATDERAAAALQPLAAADEPAANGGAKLAPAARRPLAATDERTPARAVRTDPDPAPPSIDGELELLGAAQIALQKQRPTRALSLLQEHAFRFPTGALIEERMAMQALALCALQRRSAAQTVLSNLEARGAQSQLLPRVRSQCGL